MKILVLDNYDSFTYNLVKLVRDLDLGTGLEVCRNDEINVQDCRKFEKILIGPGPGLPKDAGITLELIRTLGHEADILGICLGHQAIAEIFGARLFNLDEVLHGIANEVTVTDLTEKLFQNLPAKFTAGHYHSWAVEPNSIGSNIIVTATGHDGLVMGIRHYTYQVRGLQFHPESIMTENGDKIIENWLIN